MGLGPAVAFVFAVAFGSTSAIPELILTFAL